MSSIEDIRKRNKEKRERYAEKDKEHVAWNGTAFVPSMPEPEPPPTVTVKDHEPEPEKTFVDRMRAKFAPGTPASEPTKQTATRGKPKPNLMLTVFPGMAATFISTFLTDIYKDPYKPCAPTKDEAQLIITPLFEEIARAIKVTGKIDETTENLLNCVAMMALYGARAYQTYVDIKGREKDNAGSTARSRTGNNGTTVNGRIPVQDTGTIRPDNINSTTTDTKGNDDDNIANGDESDERRREREAALVHDMFKRDIEGRIRLGVLPARVRDETRNTDQ